jgi:hypothetical protein
MSAVIIAQLLARRFGSRPDGASSQPTNKQGMVSVPERRKEWFASPYAAGKAAAARRATFSRSA